MQKYEIAVLVGRLNWLYFQWNQTSHPTKIVQRLCVSQNVQNKMQNVSKRTVLVEDNVNESFKRTSDITLRKDRDRQLQ